MIIARNIFQCSTRYRRHHLHTTNVFRSNISSCEYHIHTHLLWIGAKLGNTTNVSGVAARHKSLSNDRHIVVPTILSSTRMLVPITHDITSGSQYERSTYVCICMRFILPLSSVTDDRVQCFGPEIRLMHPQ